jgi:hypothetical protein
VDAFDRVLEIIEQSKTFGFRQLATGAKLYGHVPHVAPEAWLHQLYAPLSDEDILSLEEKMGETLPSDFRLFLHLANGVGLFSASLSIYGKRTSYSRSGDEAWQPFCIVTANTFDKPVYAQPGQLVVGSYRNDGSLVFLDVNNETAFRTKSRSKKILNRWANFWTMLRDETCRLSELFDTQGRNLSGRPTTPPPDA